MMLRGAERVWPTSAARGSQTARAWPRAAQHLFYPKSKDEPFVIDA